jgi:transposase
VTDEGEILVVERQRLEHADRKGMIRWLRTQAAGTQGTGTPVAMEAAFGWPWIADLLEEEGFEPHLAHPPATRVLAKHRAKTDRCDADRLGEFYLQGILPESYLAPPEVRSHRDRIRYRMALSCVRTGIKNRIQASSRHLASYAGLAPVSNDSADRRGPRHLSAACNHTLRWALLEAANVIARCGAKRAPRLWRLYQRLSHRGRTNKNQAKVAVARELIKLVHVVWSKRQPYTTTPSPRPGMNNALDKKQDRKRAPQSDKEGAQHCRRSDQPRHAMVRRASTDAGQTLL